jgi:Zn-dependent protease/CBS domain-containing protein
MGTLHGVKLATIFGIDVRADWSVLIVFALLAWGLATVSLPSIASGYSNTAYWIVAIAITCLFLLSLLAHELSHSVVARRLGIRVRDITLWLFGGVSSLEDEARTPRGDFQIAFAGPATSIVIGVVAGAIGGFVALFNGPPLIVAGIEWLAGINILLAIFNLIPAAPLDGGRVLRAYLWYRSGDHDAASIKAARAGNVFGWLLIALGVLDFMAGGDIGGIWFVFLGWFLLAASRGEEMQVLTQHALHDVRVGDIMTRSPVTAPAAMSVADVLDRFMLVHHGSAFPVVDDGGRVVGLVTLKQAKAVSPSQRPSTRIDAVATPIADVTVARPDEPIVATLRRATTNDGRVLVFEGGALVGIVTPSDVSRAVAART